MEKAEIPQTEIDRFWSMVSRPEEGCWEWQAGCYKAGYGCFYPKIDGQKRQIYAHRFSYLLSGGDLSADTVVCHRCDNPKCVRSDHLFGGTKKDNSQDMSKKGRAGMQKRTHCKHGHPLTDASCFHVDAKGVRSCLICHRAMRVEIDRRSNAKRAAAKLPQTPALPPNTFVCVTCGQLCDLSVKTGSNHCKPCRAAYNRQQRAANPERYNAITRAYKARKRAERKNID